MNDDNQEFSLEDALDILSGIPQREIAAEIGISERRLRDIEWGRAKPRRRTRDAILDLARSMDSAGHRAGGGTSIPAGEGTANQSGGLWFLLVAALVVAVFVWIYWSGHQPYS